MKQRLSCFLLALLAWVSPALAQSSPYVIVLEGPLTSSANCTVQRNAGNTAWVCTAPSAASQPLTDSSGLIADDADPTKVLYFQLSGLTTGTNRTWTIPDANITIPSTIASLAANTFTGLQTANGGIAATTITASSTLDVTGTATFASHVLLGVGDDLRWGTIIGSFGGRFGRYVTDGFLLGLPGTTASQFFTITDSNGAGVLTLYASGPADLKGQLNAQTAGTATSGFYNVLNGGSWDMIGYDSSNYMVIGGYRTSQWAGIKSYGNSGSLLSTLNSTGLTVNTPASVDAFLGGLASFAGHNAMSLNGNPGYSSMAGMYSDGTDTFVATPSNLYVRIAGTDVLRLYSGVSLFSNSSLGVGPTTPNIGGWSRAITLSATGAGNTVAYEGKGNVTSDGPVVGFTAHNDATSIGGWAFERSGANNSGRWRLFTTNAGTAVYHFGVSASGNVGIRATSQLNLDGADGTGDTYLVEASENLAYGYAGGSAIFGWTMGLLFPGNSGVSLGNSTNKWTEVWATNGAIQTSDRTRKRNITDSDLGIDFVMGLRPSRFEMLDEPGVARYGLIAQDVIAAAKGRSLVGIVTGNREGDYGLNYASLITPVISVVQHHQTQIAAMQVAIDELRATVARLQGGK